LLVLFVLLGNAVGEKGRLIAFNETYQKWLSPKEAALLEIESDNFMDITNFPEPKPKKFQEDPIPGKITHKELVGLLIQEMEIANLRSTIDSLSAYYTRYYKSDTGKEASEWMFKQFTELSAGRSDITVEYFEHSFAMPSVIARIKGSGKDDAGATRVVLGAHLDSVAATRAPGADDDASGSSTILEVFRVFAQSGFKPYRTLEFHAYSAEEGGLLGSQDIAKTYYTLDIDVEAMFQLDMTMYGKNETQPLGIVTDYVNPPLTQFLRLVTAAYTVFPFIDTKCGYGCSDHASWTKYGFRSAFIFEATFAQKNPYIHTANDLLSYLNLRRGFQIGQIAIGFLVEIAGGSF